MLTSTQRLYLELGWISETLCVCPVTPCWPSSLYFWGAHKAEVRTLTPPKESLLFMLTFSITFAVKEVFCCDLLLLETKSKVAAMALLVFEETSNFPTVTHTHCREEGGWHIHLLRDVIGWVGGGEIFSLTKLVNVPLCHLCRSA